MSGVVCPFAVQETSRRCKQPSHKRIPYGVCLHTTGSGVLDSAKKHGITPLAVALNAYFASQNGSNGYYWGGPAYVIDHDGTVHQVADDDVNTAHCGSDLRNAYLDGSWEHITSPKALELWKRKWSSYKSPQHLFPHTSPNIDFIGCECIPCGEGFGIPMSPGLLFTHLQHNSAIKLCIDIADRWGFPIGWESTSRLLGHEDLQPVLTSVNHFGRGDQNGCWDVGFLRDKPYFDFAYVRNAVHPA